MLPACLIDEMIFLRKFLVQNTNEQRGTPHRIPSAIEGEDGLFGGMQNTILLVLYPGVAVYTQMIWVISASNNSAAAASTFSCCCFPKVADESLNACYYQELLKIDCIIISNHGNQHITIYWDGDLWMRSVSTLAAESVSLEDARQPVQVLVISWWRLKWDVLRLLLCILIEVCILYSVQ